MEKQLLNILNELNEMTSTNKIFIKGIISLVNEANNAIDLELIKEMVKNYTLMVSTEADKEYERLDEIYESLSEEISNMVIYSEEENTIVNLDNVNMINVQKMGDTSYSLVCYCTNKTYSIGYFKSKMSANIALENILISIRTNNNYHKIVSDFA